MAWRECGVAALLDSVHSLVIEKKIPPIHSGVAETADENPSTEQRRILGALSAAGTTKARTGAEWYTKKKVR